MKQRKWTICLLLALLALALCLVAACNLGDGSGKKYNITYVLGRDEATHDNPTQYTRGQELKLKDAQCPMYGFAGWYLDEDFTQRKVIIDEYDKGDITLYACWEYVLVVENNVIVNMTWYGSLNCTDLVIPEEIDGVRITAIDDYAFNASNQITNLVIPESITYIGYSALGGCNKLVNLTLPFVGETKNGTNNMHLGYIFGEEDVNINNVSKAPKTLENLVVTNGTKIGDYAFGGCSSLRSITLPDSVTSIGDYAFRDCSGLTSITIPESVTSIGAWAFSKCDGLTSITIDENVTSIGSYAFYLCSSLNAVNISNLTAWCNIEFADDNANPLCFAHNLYLNGKLVTNLEIPAGLTNIKNHTFYNCTSITDVTIPESVTSISPRAFHGCIGLTAVRISNLAAWCNIEFGGIYGNPLYYGHNLYLNGELVKNLEIPQGVTTVKKYAFSGGTGFTSITIPSSVTTISYGAFYGCTSVTTATIPFVGEKLDGSGKTRLGNMFDEFSNTDNNDNVPDSLTTVVITGSTTIGNRAFSGCRNIVNVTIPESVTSIDYGAFWNCNSLTSIIIPENITSIGAVAFSGCNSLATVYWNAISCASNVNATSGPFSDCSAITTLEIGANVQSIPNYAFAKCTGLISVTIPNHVTSIGLGAFLGCTSLEDITVPFIGETKNGTDNAYFNYIFGAKQIRDDGYVPQSLNNVTVMDGVIGDYAFYGLRNITNVTIPDNITTIGKYAFDYCISLTSITLPEGLTSIGEYAFSDCRSLPSINIPERVTSIGVSAFGGCDKLKSVYVTNLTAWCNIDFELGDYGDFYSNPLANSNMYLNGQLVTNLIIPEDVTTIKTLAFTYCKGITSVTIHQGVTNIENKAFDSANYVKTIETVYYGGTPEQWQEISIGDYNYVLITSTKYYYSQEEPALNQAGTDYDGNYWHWVDGEPAIWKKEN